MEHIVGYGKRTLLYLCLFQLSIWVAFAQTPSSARCQVSTSPTPVRAEGLTERLGDITLQCSGATPGAAFSGNFTLFVSAGITNRVDGSNLTRDAVLSVDLGSGYVPTGIAGLVSGSSISFNGVSYTTPATGMVNLRISGVRASMNQMGYTSSIPVQVTGNLSSTLAIDQAQINLAYSQAGMLSNMGSAGISCYGSPLPDTLNLASLFTAGTALASTRVTEGFASAFEARSTGLDFGTRFLVKYSGFPSNARLFIPDAVAGSDALQPTSGGDLNLSQAVGQYMPGSGTLVLVRVNNADATGAGGFAVSAPQGSGAVTLGSVSEVMLSGGSGYAVYEVADANPSAQESAQFPTFVSLPLHSPAAVAQETVALAPVSSVTMASATAPIPRFAAVAGLSDCALVGDCTTPYVAPPKLSVEATPIFLSATAGGGAMTSPAGSFAVHNVGKGNAAWSLSVAYYPGSTGWVVLSPMSGTNEGTVKVTVDTKTLTTGGYQAEIIVNGGAAGSQSVHVALNVTAGTAPPPPVTPAVVVSQVLNAATLQVAPLVPGSLATLMGSHLSGKSVVVTFDGTPAALIYASDTQINLQVPASLVSKTSASLMVTADGVSSTPLIIPLATAWPAVFPHGVLNQDGRENTTAVAAKAGEILQIFATGIPQLATVSVQIGDHKDLAPYYAGDAPTAPGVQQVNVAVPAGVAGTVSVVISATVNGQQYYSPAYSISVQ